MKKNEFFEAMNNIDAELIERADKKVTLRSRRPGLKIAAIAACLAVLVAGLVAVLPMLLDTEPEDLIIWENAFDMFAPVYGAGATADPNDLEHAKYPIFEIVGEKYSKYLIRNAYPIEMNGEMIDKKIDDITVMNGLGYFSDSPEVERDTKPVKAEVYAVKGVAPDAGVAIKFIEEGPFNSLEHYYAAVNTDYEYTTFADFINDYNAPVFMSVSREVRLMDNSRMDAAEYEKFNFTNAVNDEICKILLTLDAPAEITNGYSTNDERIADVNDKPVLELIVELDSMGDNYCRLWVHKNGYIAYSGFRQPTVFFNVGNEATDAILKLFYENSELVSVVKVGPDGYGLVEYPVN